MKRKRKSVKVAECHQSSDTEVKETAGTRPRRKSKKLDQKPDSSDLEDEETPGTRPRRKSKKLDQKPDSSDLEDEETPGMRLRRKSKDDDYKPDSSDVEDGEVTSVSGFEFMAKIKNLSVSSQIKEKLLKLCKRVEKTFKLTEKQIKKVRAFKCETEGVSNMEADFPFTHGIYKADEREKPVKKSVFTADEIRKIKENYSRFCKKFGFHPKKDLNVFLPSTFRQSLDGRLSHKQEKTFLRYLSDNINRPPRSVYRIFMDTFYFYRKGGYTKDEDELMLSWYELNPGKHIYSVLGRILRRNRFLVRRRVLRLTGQKGSGYKRPDTPPHVKDIKIRRNNEYPDWTMKEKAWREIAEADGESTVKQLKKSYFRDLYPSVKASVLVSSNSIIYALITKLMSLDNPTWDNVDWIKLGQYCFNVGAVRVYSAVRTLTKKYVPKEHWKDLATALKTIKEKHHVFNGPKRYTQIGRLKELLSRQKDDDNDSVSIDIDEPSAPSVSDADEPEASSTPNKIKLTRKGRIKESCWRSMLNSGSDSSSACSNDDEKLDEKVELKPRKRIKESCWRSMLNSGSDSSSVCSNDDEKLDGKVERKPRNRIKESCWRSMLNSGSDSSSVCSHEDEKLNEKVERKPRKRIKESCLRELEIDVDSGAVSDFASSAVSSYSNQVATRTANSVVGQQSRYTEREVQVVENGDMIYESEARERLSNMTDGFSTDGRESEAAVVLRNKKEKLGDVSSEMEELTTASFEDDSITHTVASSPKKRKNLLQKSKEILGSCKSSCEDQSVENSDGGTRKNSDSGDRLSTVGNPNVTASECVDSDTEERKLKVEESDSNISPKKKLVESDQLIDDRIAHSVADSPRKRKKLCKTSKENLDCCGGTCEDQSVENADGGTSRKSADSGDQLSTVGNPNFDANALDVTVPECIDSDTKERKLKLQESDSKMSPKKELVESGQLINDRIAHLEKCVKCGKYKLYRPASAFGNPDFDTNALDVTVSECIDSDKKDLKLKSEELECKVSPKKILLESDHLIDVELGKGSPRRISVGDFVSRRRGKKRRKD